MDQGVIAAMKVRYRSGLLKMLVDEDDLITFWKKLTVLDAIHGIFKAWADVKPQTLVRSWRKLLPDLEENDFNGFPDDDSSTTEIMTMVKVLQGFENVDEVNVREWINTDACEPGYQHLSDAEIVNNAVGGGEPMLVGSEGGESDKETSPRVSHSAAMQSIDNVLDYMSQMGFEYTVMTLFLSEKFVWQLERI